MTDLIDNPLLLRSLVLGAFGGAGLVLVALYSRRGPLIFVPYAALAILLGLLLTRYATLPFNQRVAAAFAAYLLATTQLYFAVFFLARKQRQRMVQEGTLSPSAMTRPVPLWTRVWHISLVLGLGAAGSAAVAYVAS